MATETMDFSEIGVVQFLGIEGREHAAGRTVVALAPKPRHLNHNGDLHAAVLFAIAETAGVGAAVSGIGDLMSRSFIVVRDAFVEYVARARGNVAEFVGTGVVEAGEFERGCAAVRAGEAFEFASQVEVADAEGKVCMRVRFTTVVRPRRS